MRRMIFVLFLLSASLNLFSQPTEYQSKMTSEEMEQVRINALQIPSVINATSSQYKLLLDDNYDWLNNIGSDKNELYFNIFHTKNHGSQILNRYCADFYDDVTPTKVAIKLDTDNNTKYIPVMCGKDAKIVNVSTKTPTLKINNGEFNVKALITDDYQAYYELYSTNKKYKLVFYNGKKEFPTWYPHDMIAQYREHLVSSEIKELDTYGDLKSYGMVFNHLNNGSYYRNIYCASVQDVNKATKVGNVVFYIDGGEAFAKCAGVSESSLIKIKLPDPGINNIVNTIPITYKDVVFNLTFNGYQEDLRR